MVEAWSSDGSGVKGTQTLIGAQKATVKVRSRKYEVRSARTIRTHIELFAAEVLKARHGRGVDAESVLQIWANVGVGVIDR